MKSSKKKKILPKSGVKRKLLFWLPVKLKTDQLPQILENRKYLLVVSWNGGRNFFISKWKLSNEAFLIKPLINKYCPDANTNYYKSHLFSFTTPSPSLLEDYFSILFGFYDNRNHCNSW